MEKENKINESQVFDIITGEEVSWQAIIYDLVKTEQLDPWDINITILTEKYLEKIAEIEETDFFISSKVLLAATLLLRIKSEILLNKHVKDIDDILFEKSEKKKYVLEKIELEEEIPQLIPRSPIPRHKRITLKELIESLNKAISTENRRIKREIINKNVLREAGFSLPKKRFSIKNKIKEIHNSLFEYFKTNQEKKKIGFTEFIGNTKEEKINAFLPLLHLENQKKVWLEQQNHFDEIYIWFGKTYLRENPNFFKDLNEEM